MHSTVPAVTPALIQQVHTLMRLGRTELDKKNLDRGLEYFHQATTLLPEDPALQLDQGISLSRFGKEHKRKDILLLSNKKFKNATTYSSEDAWTLWHCWGSTLSELGFLSEEFHYFLEAKEKLVKAVSLSSKASPIDQAEILAEYAVVQSMIAKHSKEAYDWRLAIEAFENTLAISSKMSYEFWNHFGVACMELAKLLIDIQLYVQAIQHFKKAVTDEPKHLGSWENLCSAMQALYFHTQDEEHFSQINQCFEMCVKLSLSATTYRDWAAFLLKASVTTSSVNKVTEALKKCEEAYGMGLEEDPLLLSTWGESMTIIGLETENIQLLQEGQAKIEEALNLDPDNPLLWKAFGESYHAFGLYFDELDYHYLAIEKLQSGLSIDRTQHSLWQAIGLTYMHVGVVIEDLAELKRALYFLEKAIDLQPYNPSYVFSKACCLSRMGELTRQESYLVDALAEFEKALQIHKHALHLHPDWLFEYAKALDLYADFFEEEHYYHKAIELFLHVLVAEPDYPKIYQRLALTYSHLAELSQETQNFHRALYFFKLALKRSPEDDQILVDFAVTLISLSQRSHDKTEIESYLEEAKRKLLFAAQAGNGQAYYQLACLFSLTYESDKALLFLQKAEASLSLPPLEEILEDEWLDHVRSLEEFHLFVQEIERKQT